MGDRSGMHCELHGDYRCRRCFTVDGWDRSAQYVQKIEQQLAEARTAIGGLRSQLTAEREQVDVLRSNLKEIRGLHGENTVAYRIADRALSEGEE